MSRVDKSSSWDRSSRTSCQYMRLRIGSRPKNVGFCAPEPTNFVVLNVPNIQIPGRTGFDVLDDVGCKCIQT